MALLTTRGGGLSEAGALSEIHADSASETSPARGIMRVFNTAIANLQAETARTCSVEFDLRRCLVRADAAGRDLGDEVVFAADRCAGQQAERGKLADVREGVGQRALEQLLGRAAERGMRLRMVGAGHSFSDIALTEGAMIGLGRMSRVLDADRSSGLVKVQAGITIHDLSTELDRHGLAMENLGDIDVQSIAGAISTATHGTGARLPNISSQVA